MTAHRTNPPLVTVVIPAYNAARFLPRTLQSVCAQTYRHLQILVVDDGSVDDTARIVEHWAGNDPRIELYSKPNGGLASARNAGISAARGPILAFLDADDLWHPEKLERQMAVLHAADPGPAPAAVYALTRYIDEEDRVLYDSPLWQIHGPVLARHLLCNFIGSGGSNLLCRTDAAIAVGGFDTSYQPRDAGFAEDYDFQLKLAARYQIGVVPQYLVGYRQHGGAMSRDQRRMARSLRSIVEHHLALNPHLSSRCRRMALGGVLVREAGAFVQARKPGQALLAGMHLLWVDPLRAAAELVRRLPARATRHGAPPAHPFEEMDPNAADPRRVGALMSRRLSTLLAEDLRIERDQLGRRAATRSVTPVE